MNKTFGGALPKNQSSIDERSNRSDFHVKPVITLTPFSDASLKEDDAFSFQANEAAAFLPELSERFSEI